MPFEISYEIIIRKTVVPYYVKMMAASEFCYSLCNIQPVNSF